MDDPAKLADARYLLMDAKTSLASAQADLQATSDAVDALNAQLAAANAQIASLQASNADLTNQLKWAGIDKTGATDVTDAVQAILDKAGAVTVPAGRYLIDPVKALKVRSNTSLTLDPSAIFVATPNSADGYNVLLVELVDNVQITGGQILGERDKHLGTTGEGGMGIRIRGAANVTVTGTQCLNFWGDGIVVGPYKGSPYIVSRNVTLKGVTCSGNRRNGLSPGNVVGFLAEDCTFSDNGNDPDGAGPIIGGTSPFCGVDVEPDDDPASTVAGEAHDFTFRRCTFKDNHTHGINIFHRVYNIAFDNCDFTSNGSCGLNSYEAHGIALTGSRVNGNGARGVQIGVDNTGVAASGNTLGTNTGALPRATALVGDGLISTRDLSVGAVDRVVGTNTYV